MSDEQKAFLLKMLAFNLDLNFDFYDAQAISEKNQQLDFFLESAIKFIETEGITLDYSETGDNFLVVAYAEWLYNKRKEPSSQMPRMLRYNLNNRLFHEKLVDNG